MINTVSIEEFANRYRLSVNTVKKNFEMIKGAYISNGEYIIPDSCRYPFFPKNMNLKTRNDKKYAIIKATHEYKYIDNTIVGISKNSFLLIVKELLESGLITSNGSGDINGLNGYDTTDHTDEVIRNNSRKNKVINDLFINAGCFVGSAGASYKNHRVQ